VDRLLSGATVDLIVTDQPYNVDYQGYTEQRLKIQGDRMSHEQFQQFLVDSFGSYRRIVKPGASAYICHSSSWQREFQNALEQAGFQICCQIIWASPVKKIPGTETSPNRPCGKKTSPPPMGSTRR
jgi:DNA modification methylase